MPKEKKMDAWNKCAKREYTDKGIKPTLGMIMGGCPNCGHLCSFDDEEFECFRCGWSWKKELI